METRPFDERPPHRVVQYAGRVNWVTALSILGGILLPLLYIVAWKKTGAMRTAILWWASGATVLVGLGLIACWWRLRVARQRIEQLGATIDGSSSNAALRSVGALISDVAVLKPDTFFLKGYSNSGESPGVFQFYSRVPIDEGAPFDIEFEPRELDEANRSMLLLDEDEAERADPRDDNELSDFGRHVRRNAIFAGGRWVLVMWGGIVLYHVVMSYLKNSIEWEVLVWGAVLTSFLLPRRGKVLNAFDWFLVPGGLLARRKRSKQGEPDALLFTQRESSMVLVQTRERLFWVTVGDGDRSARLTVTPTEAAYLLRAWRSGVPAPTVERCGDFVGT